MPEMHLRQPKFACSAWDQFLKIKKLQKKNKETKDSRYNYHNESD